MTNQESFIKKIAPLVQKYAPIYGISVCSPIIAQACLESGYGTSSLADVYNFFGLKWRNGRCAVSNEWTLKKTNEQRKDGSYYSINAKFMKFHSLEEGIEGYFQWTNISAYSNLKGVTDPETYLQNIKADKYATSLNYVQNNMNVIKKYNLTQYDTAKEVTGMKINIHAGHNPDGKTACGAVGLIKESTEARDVKNRVMAILQANGHTVHDCTVDNGTSQNDVLKKIVAKCNSNSVDMDISIHFNSGAKDTVGNGQTTGAEVYIFDDTLKTQATYICGWLEKIGFKNRGVKYGKDLYVLRNTKAPAMLIEVCFVDDADDTRIYNANKELIANSISAGILGFPPQDVQTTTPVVENNVTESTSVAENNVTESASKNVTINTSSLNVRADGNASAKVLTTLQKGTTVAITETKGNWGKFEGWINLSYTKEA